jgi:hypothetical protein
VDVTVTDCSSERAPAEQDNVKVLVAFKGAVVSVPEVVFEPLQSPEALQLVALAEDHVSVVVAPCSTVIASALKDTVGAAGGGGAALTLTVAERCVVPPAPVQSSVKVLVVLSAIVDWLPEVALLPAHAPLAAQPVALVDDHVSVELPPALTDVGLAENVTPGAAISDTVAVFCVVPPLPEHARVNVLATLKGPTF